VIRFFLSIAEMGELMSRPLSFFDTDDRLRSLSEAGDPLERLSTVIDFELFRPELEAVLGRRDRGKGGRPPYDAVLMFKVLVVQTLYTLSDDQTEYQIKDRLSFMRFVGLELCDPVPDAKTIWLYRETLARAGAFEGLFERFDTMLRNEGWLAKGGQIVDADRGAPSPPDQGREGHDQGRRYARPLEEGPHGPDRPRWPLDHQAGPQARRAG